MSDVTVKKDKGLRFPELDSLRGIAVIVVLLYHYTYAYDFHFGLLSNTKLYFLYGDLAVQLFFVISGFVIFLTLERSKTKLDFLVNRFSRLYPAYWVGIILTTLFTIIWPIPTLGHYSVKEILVNLTMFQGFFKIRLIDQVYWTLKYELIFYIIMYFIFISGRLKYINLICLAWLLVAASSMVFTFPLKKYIDVLLITDQAAYFIAGISFYKIKAARATLFDYILIALSFLVGCCWLYKRNDGDLTYLFVLALIFALFFLFVFRGIEFLNNKVLLFLGTISYPLYLLHNVIGYSIINQLRKHTDLQVVYVTIPFLITLMLAIVVNKYVEKPALNYIRVKYKNFRK